MSSTITVKVAAEVMKLGVAGHESLKEQVEKGVYEAEKKSGMQLQLGSIFFNNSKAPVESWEMRLIGSQAVTIIAEPVETFMEVIQKMSARLSNLEQREVIAWEPRLRNLATEILLHACGKQEFCTTSSGYFAMLAAARDSGLQQVTASMQMKLTQVATEADSVLTRWNMHVHPGSLESLEAEVNTVWKGITTELQQMCLQDCRFVLAYEVIKGAFPERFKWGECDAGCAGW